MVGRTITQRIALDGGRSVKDELEQIGAAAQAAFNKLAGANAVNASLARLGTSVNGIAQRIALLRAASQNVGDSFQNFSGHVQTTASRFVKLTAGLGLVAGGFAALIKMAGDSQEALQNTADTLGTTVEKWQALSSAADLSGIDPSVLEKSMLKLVSAMNAARDSSTEFGTTAKKLAQDLAAGRITQTQYGQKLLELRASTKEASNVFKDLGVSIVDSSGGLRDVTDVFNDVSDAFSRIPDGADKASMSMQLFGTRNAKVAAFANSGAAGIEKMTLAAQRLAPALDKEGRASLDRASDAFKKLGEAGKATSNQILAVFAPGVSRLVEAYTQVVVRARDTWVSYARTIEAKVRPVVDDLVALLEGRDVDVKNSFILKARDAVVQFGVDVQNAVTRIIIPSFMALLGVLDTVANAINGVFGTNLTGNQLAIALVLTKLLGLFGVFTSAVKLAWSVVGLLIANFGALEAAGTVLIRAFGALATTIIGSFGLLPTLIAAVGFAIGFLIVSIIQKFGGISGIIEAVKGAFASLGTAIGNVLSGIGSFFESIFATISAQTAQFVQSVIAWFMRIPETVVLILQLIAAAFVAGWEAVTSLAQSAVDSIVGAFKSGFDSIIGFLGGLYDRAKSIFASIISAAASVASAIASAVSGGSGAGGGAAPQGFAGGGAVNGPGSGTSDSILIRASNGEFMVRKKAVDSYGLRFMDAINRGLIPVQRIREIMSGMSFEGIGRALGAGLTPQRSFANGGAILAGAGAANGSGGRPVIFNMDGQSFPLSGDPDVVATLERYATSKHVRSAGRKPRWY